MTPQAPQQAAEEQRQQAALNEWEREDAIRKTTMKTLLLFLWTKRHALAALAIKALEAKLSDEARRVEVGSIRQPLAQSDPFPIGGTYAVPQGATSRIPTEHDTASAILEARK